MHRRGWRWGRRSRAAPRRRSRRERRRTCRLRRSPLPLLKCRSRKLIPSLPLMTTNSNNKNQSKRNHLSRNLRFHRLPKKLSARSRRQRPKQLLTPSQQRKLLRRQRPRNLRSFGRRSGKILVTSQDGLICCSMWTARTTWRLEGRPSLSSFSAIPTATDTGRSSATSRRETGTQREPWRCSSRASRRSPSPPTSGSTSSTTSAPSARTMEVFEQGLKAIPLSADLWIHFLNHQRAIAAADEMESGGSGNLHVVRQSYERAVADCGREWRSDKLWDHYVKWETEAGEMARVYQLYQRILKVPTQGAAHNLELVEALVKANTPKDL